MPESPEFNLSTIYGNPYKRTGHFGVTYRGINFVKCPFDYVLYQMIVCSVKPDLIIEIGTHEGGGSLYLADLLEKNQIGEIHTIDLTPRKYHPLVENHPRIKTFFGGFQLYEIPKKCYSENFKTIIIDDGSHLCQDVISAFEKFHHLVSKDSFYIIEDSIMEFFPELPRDNPHRAIDYILKNYIGFGIAKEFCDFFGKDATFNVNGYLQKVK